MTNTRHLAAQLAAIDQCAARLLANLDALVAELDAEASGLRAAGYEPRGGSDRPPDPTGEIATSPPPGARAAATLADTITQAFNAMTAADAIRRLWLSSVAPAPDDAEALWCRSCRRDNGYCEPATSRRLCRWCATFERAHGQLPPRRLLAMRHRGERISTADVARALRHDDAGVRFS